MTPDPLGSAAAPTAFLIAVGIAVTSVEYLVSLRDYRDTGLYSWAIQNERRVFVRHPALARRARVLLDLPGFAVVLAVRLAAAVALAICVVAATGPRALLLVLLVVTTAAVNFRHTYGLDGSDQMTFVVVVSVAVHALAPAGSVAGQVAIVFVAAQACLAYLASGVAKAVSPQWRSGRAVFAVLNTESYGRRDVATVLSRHPAAARVLTWSVVAFECAFPLALLGPGVALVVLGLGVAMHLGIALGMGLNSFVWAFVATYPAVYAVATVLD